MDKDGIVPPYCTITPSPTRSLTERPQSSSRHSKPRLRPPTRRPQLTALPRPLAPALSFADRLPDDTPPAPAQTPAGNATAAIELRDDDPLCAGHGPGFRPRFHFAPAFDRPATRVPIAGGPSIADVLFGVPPRHDSGHAIPKRPEGLL